MKITLFTDADVFAGTERHILDLATALREDGHAAEIACPAHGILAERARGAGVPVFAVEKGPRIDLAAVRRLARRLRAGEVDLIHSHNGRTVLIAALAVTLAGRGHAVTTQHFTSPARTLRTGLRGCVSRALHRWVTHRTDQIIAISEAVRKGIIERGEAPGRKVTMVWNGIPDPSAQALRPESDVRAQFHIPADVPLVVSAVRLEPEKAVHILVEAMALLRASMPNFRCIIAGEGRQREQLQAQIDRLGLAEHIQLAGYQTDVLSIVNAADLFVLPSLEEPFGLALIEAMALGKPAIATRSGGPLEIVKEGESGLLVAPADAAQLHAAMARILADRDLADDLARNARERFLTCFTVRQMSQKIAAVYRRAFTPQVAAQPCKTNSDTLGLPAPTRTSGAQL